jgi:hypothetical protein
MNVTECHKRWILRRNRREELPGFRDEWYKSQCLFCRFYIPLAGEFIDDWGVCSNPDSPFDRRVMFEHDGCNSQSPADEVWSRLPLEVTMDLSFIDELEQECPADGPSLVEDEQHADRCEARWMQKLHIRVHAPLEAVCGAQQCCSCKHYQPLVDEFTSCWGACTSEKSAFDGWAMYRLDGCQAWSPAETGKAE